MPQLRGGIVQNGVFLYADDGNCYTHTTYNLVGVLQLKFDLIWPQAMADGADILLMVDGVRADANQSWVN